jgi:hypothetical protein
MKGSQIDILSNICPTAFRLSEQLPEIARPANIGIQLHSGFPYFD